MIQQENPVEEEEEGYKHYIKCLLDKLKRARVSKKTFTIILTKAEEGGYISECLELPTAHSQGDTVEETVSNVKDAISLVIGYLKDKAKNKKGENFWSC